MFVTEHSKEDDIPIGDCIAVDIDNEGNFNGFTIRSDMCKLIMFRDKGQLDAIHKIIKNVNFMNRLVLENNKDYILGQKKETKNQKDFECQVDTYEPVIIEKEVRKEEPAEKKSKPEGSVSLFSPELKEFMSRLKEHVIDIIMRDNPKKKAYYRMVWEDQTLEELVHYKIANVYEDVPTNGFEKDDDRPDDMDVGQYFKVLFKTLEEKLE